MWILTVRSPDNEPLEYVLRPGKNTLGRKPDNDIVVADDSASREHAEIYCQGDQIVITDLESTNGTYVNRERIVKPHVLQPGDQIRIGQHVVDLSDRNGKSRPDLVKSISGTRPLTRELLLESVDQHAILLYDVASRLTTVLDLETALKEISKMMRVALGAERCDVILADHFKQLDKLGFPVAIAQQAIDQRSVVIVPDLVAHDKQSPKSSEPQNIHSALCIPVMIGQEPAALIIVYKIDPSARDFDQHDVQLAVAIAHQAALTIQRVGLFEQARMLEEWAITDSLTGMNNRRRILTLCELEFQRSRRFNHPMSLLMMDLDDFKAVNDTHGHNIGDQVLTTIAMRCREQLRNIDLIGRYGGDEFLVLLVETDLDAARIVAERIRSHVAEAPVDTDIGKLKITISVGITSLEKDTPNLDALLNRADKAMYAAKKTGRNRVKGSSQAAHQKNLD
jgi:diguanylate cyclase (GGDEF)-like protein